MKTKPLTQLRELIAAALKSQANLSKSFQSFFIETMELILTHTGRLNFTQMARCGRSCESRFRQNFRKSFDWLSFNRSFLESTKGHRIAIAIDPCYISKSGKKTPGIDWFWSGCAAAMKKGLEILGISIVDADAKDSVFLKAEQTFTDKKRGRKPDCTKGMKDPDSLTGWYLRMLNRNCKQLLSICKLIVADAYFSKESFVTGAKTLGFDLISRFRDDVNLKYMYTGPKSGKRGRPQKFAGKVDLKNLDMNVFTEDYTTEGKLVYQMYTAVVGAVSLGCEVRVVLVDYEDAEQKRQTRKVFFSTDTSMSARDIFDIAEYDSETLAIGDCHAYGQSRSPAKNPTMHITTAHPIVRHIPLPETAGCSFLFPFCEDCFLFMRTFFISHRSPKRPKYPKMMSPPTRMLIAKAIESASITIVIQFGLGA